MKLLPKTKFYSKASYLLRNNTPIETIYELKDEYDVSEEDIKIYLENVKKSKAVSSTVAASSKELQLVYNKFDSMFLDEFPHIILMRRGETPFFYEYKEGVYQSLTEKDMYDRVDGLMITYSLHEFRNSSRKVKDTIGRIESSLSRKKERCFSEEKAIAKKQYLNLKNGLLDTEKLVLLPHTPSYFSTSQLPFCYDPEAKCPMFEDFIKVVSRGKESTAQMIQEMYGYCILPNNPRHKVFYLYGDIARNGKSTTAKILCGLLGWGNISTLSLQQLASDNTSILTSMMGKFLNFSDEVKSKYIDSSSLTSMSAEGIVEINPKFKNSFLYKVTNKFIVACNDLPVFQESQGMKHRMISIPFSYHIPEKDRILGYDQILIDKEGPGILNWAIEGAKMVGNNNGFSYNDESKEDMRDNVHQSNSVYAFLDSCYAFDKKYTVEYDPEEMYGYGSSKDSEGSGYRLFCSRKNVPAKSEFNFRKELKRFAGETELITQSRIENKRFYVGLKEGPALEQQRKRVEDKELAEQKFKNF